MSEGTPEGMFNFKPQLEVSNSKTPKVIPPSLPIVYGSDPHPTVTDLYVRIPKQPKPNLNIGKILKNFESDSRSCLHAAMATSRSSGDPTESDST